MTISEASKQLDQGLEILGTAIDLAGPAYGILEKAHAIKGEISEGAQSLLQLIGGLKAQIDSAAPAMHTASQKYEEALGVITGASGEIDTEELRKARVGNAGLVQTTDSDAANLTTIRKEADAAFQAAETLGRHLASIVQRMGYLTVSADRHQFRHQTVVTGLEGAKNNFHNM
jgi:hypothetical protein